ncbi:hypothetical protein GCK72_015836 [Caenorhabditis remanei]|uniref:F-box domain-containing protein n=1 Tax=Caenorhabditis remanei TaxID=31234 RepID=A0A6A5GXL9_CAERE|nr:hypothetical protein GCK72_015836 [Caenorhabditis remanei]KAF1759369.1 hypothetical protein GCK72_015836 [Caenorhabditis remanei]
MEELDWIRKGILTYTVSISIVLSIFIKTMIGSLRIGRAGIWKSGVTENGQMSERTANTEKINMCTRPSMPALPILKLPMLVLKKILRSIDFDTVYPISLCSRKMFHLVKNFRDKTGPLYFTVDGEEGSHITVGTTNYGFIVCVSPMAKKSKTAKSVNINGRLVPIDRAKEEGDWNTYWNDEIQGIPTVYEYLSELLEYKCAPEVVVSRNTLWLLSYIEKRQGDNYHLVIGDIGEEEEVCHFIFYLESS